MKINFPPLEELPENVKDKLKSLPPVNLYKHIAAGYPRGFIPMLEFVSSIYSENRMISDRLREIGILRIARNTGSEYEAHQHYYLSKPAGITEKEMDTINSAEAVRSFSKEENLICRIADELCTSFKVSDNTITELYSSFATQEAVEIIVILSLYIMIACFISGTRVQIEESTPLKKQDKPI